MYKSPFNKKVRITTPFKKKGAWACGYHTGVDMVPVDGDKSPKLFAPCDMLITSVNGHGSSYGNHIAGITNDGYVILMAHMRDKPLVKVGQKVKQSQQVGIMGNTGNSYGAHLHIEVEKAKKWGYAKNLVNPLSKIDINNYNHKKASKKTYKKVSARGGLHAYNSIKDRTAATTIDEGARVELIKEKISTKYIKGTIYYMDKIKYKGKVYVVAHKYLK